MYECSCYVKIMTFFVLSFSFFFQGFQLISRTVNKLRKKQLNPCSTPSKNHNPLFEHRIERIDTTKRQKKNPLKDKNLTALSSERKLVSFKVNWQ